MHYAILFTICVHAAVRWVHVGWYSWSPVLAREYCLAPAALEVMPCLTHLPQQQQQEKQQQQY